MPPRETDRPDSVHDELPRRHEDPFVRVLHHIIRAAVRVLAVLMVFVIVWGTGDVVYVLYKRLSTPPVLLLDVNDIFHTFGAFMAVLIALEIFINIRLYLGTSQLPLQLVIATALMAIARKIIILDFEQIEPEFVFGAAAVVLALGAAYWLISRNEKEHDIEHRL